MRIHSPVLICFTLLITLPTAAPEPGSADWTIAKDTRLVEDSRDVAGNLTIKTGARLTLEGSTLRVGGLVHVRPGAMLEILPSYGVPSTISTLPGGAGFWIRVDGEMRSSGQAAAEVTGLWGDGLTSTLSGQGGLQVTGRAVLEGIHIRNGSAGLFAGEGATVILRNATVAGLGEVGIATAEGNLQLTNTTVEKNRIGLAAKGPCTIDIQDSLFLESQQEHMLINGCDVNVADSVLDGAGVAIAANNNAHVTVRDTVLRNYTIDGLGSYGSVQGGEGLLPTVRFENVTMSPAPGAQRGADVENAALIEFVNVSVSGHASHGIRTQIAILSIRDSTIWGNGGHGIRMAGGYFRDDPLSAGNLFGDQETLNGEGAISHLALLRAWGVDGGGNAVHHGTTSLDVYRTETGDPVEVLNSRDLGGMGREVIFETFRTGPGGEPQWLGPFRYQASHTEGGGLVTGEVDLSGPILLSVPHGEQASWAPLAQPVPWLLFLAGAIVAAAGLRRSGRRRGD